MDDNGERNSTDSKVCGKHIKISAEIGLKGVINAGVRFVFDKCESATENHASGDLGNAAASGWSGNAAASGERGTAVATGEQGSSSANGEQCLAVAWGKDSRAKGKLGTWLVVTEYDSGMILNAKLVQVDGLTVKEETWYTLKNGEMVEA